MLLRGESVAFLWPTKCRVRSCSGIYRNGCGFPPSLDPHFHRALTRCNVLPEHCSSGRLNAACGSTPHGKLGRFEMEINTAGALYLVSARNCGPPPVDGRLTPVPSEPVVLSIVKRVIVLLAWLAV